MKDIKERFMKEAIKEAKKAYDKLEVPIGAVIVKDNKIIIAIEKASKKLNNWRLSDCEMYVTLEPCPMCAGAILNSRIKKVYIGALDERTGACGSKINILQNKEFDTSCDIENGILEKECVDLLKAFFIEIRLLKKGE